MRKIKKTIYLLNINNYAPEITSITYPWIERYANKIGADIEMITERKWPEFAPVYEKLQIKELAKKNGSDWNIYIDSDALVHPETIDFTNVLSKNTVMHNGFDVAGVRWKYDEYFLRDGRHISSCNWFTIASDWCLDLWTPLDLTPEEAVANIQPCVGEINTIIEPSHLIDDYTLSRNIARFGFKFTTAMEIQKKLGLEGWNFFYHVYTVPIDEKVKMLKEVEKNWELDKYLERLK